MPQDAADPAAHNRSSEPAHANSIITILMSQLQPAGSITSQKRWPN